MASGSTCSGGSSSRSRRGLISCLHSLNCRHEYAPLPHDDDLRQATRNLIVGLYDQAFRRLRLPCKAMPSLYGLLSTDGLCLGPLDPVSNIILNTLALLPATTTTTALVVEPKTESSDETEESDDESMRPDRKRRRPGFDPWHEVATRSCHSLMAFLVAYFGCLSEPQALRYLYRANANLLLAVMLVQHDLYHAEPSEAALDPESDRTKAALQWAATMAGHRSPATLAQVMAIQLKHADLDLFNKHLFSANGTPLTVEDVRAIHRVLHMTMTPMCVANISNTKDGLVVHVRHNLDDGAISSETKPLVVSSSATVDARITSTAFRWEGTAISSLHSGLPSKLQACLTIADFQRRFLKASCGGDDCDYLRSLKMYLHGMIHHLYIRAFKMLHAPSGSLMRSILMAGHCYGPCDPLSNIILNSVWHDTCGSVLPASDRMMLKEYNDVLDPLSLLRLVVCSLEGLANLALFADPQSSIACVLEKLCSAKCNLVDMLSSPTKRSEKNPFHEAAMAARHPLPLQLGEFHRMLLLVPSGRSKLVSHITNAQTSGGVLCVDDIRFLMSALWSKFKETSRPQTSGTMQAPTPELCAEALRVVSSERSQYEERRSWFRSKIEQLLKNYTDQHFWGPKYELDFIFGVDESQHGTYPRTDTCFHVNFMAASDENVSRTLFYAEFWSWPLRKPKSDPEFCCPLPYAYAGRCYYDMISAKKMVYPDDAKYIDDDITHKGTRSVDGMLEMDLVHFSSELDVELARNLNMSDSQDKPYEPSSDSDSWTADECSQDSDSEDESVSGLASLLSSVATAT